MTFVWSHGPTGLPHTVRIFWRLECWPLVQPRSARKQTRRLRASAYGDDFGYAAIACFRQPSLRLSSARVAGLQSGGSYKATPAQLPPGASMEAFVASRKRSSGNSRHNAGAMMSSQSCGLSVAHPWLMLWQFLLSSNNISQAWSPWSAMVKVILASFACSTRDRSGSHCLFIFRLLSRFD